MKAWIQPVKSCKSAQTPKHYFTDFILSGVGLPLFSWVSKTMVKERLSEVLCLKKKDQKVRIWRM